MKIFLLYRIFVTNLYLGRTVIITFPSHRQFSRNESSWRRVDISDRVAGGCGGQKSQRLLDVPSVLLDLVIHFQVEQEYRTPFTIEHFLRLDDNVGYKPIKGGLLLKQRLGKSEKKLVLLVFSHSILVQLSFLYTHSTKGQIPVAYLEA